jgi:hypothetical protein
MNTSYQKITCSRKEIAKIKMFAKSRTVGIWRIKRAKIILGFLEGRTIDRLVLDVRVPPDTIKTFLKRFATEGMKVFDKPDRSPTAREASVEKILAFLEKPPPARSRKWKKVTVRYIGQDFCALEIKKIRNLIKANSHYTRARLAREICLMFDLRQSNGKFRQTGVSVILKRMDMDNVISLPPVVQNGSRKRSRVSLIFPEPQETRVFDVRELEQLHFIPVKTKSDSTLWNSLIERYHYMSGYRLWGAQMRYLLYGGKQILNNKNAKNNILVNKSRRNTAIDWNTQDLDKYRGEHLLGVLGFGAASWRIGSRDKYIGWSDEQRSKNLKLIVNNVRFLILPWIKSPNLASRILGGITRQLPMDWQARYHYKPVLLETFVQLENFRGTCYRAANWIQIGTTQGYGLDKKGKANNPPKAIFLYPLVKSFRRILCTI